MRNWKSGCISQQWLAAVAGAAAFLAVAGSASAAGVLKVEHDMLFDRTPVIFASDNTIRAWNGSSWDTYASGMDSTVDFTTNYSTLAVIWGSGGIGDVWQYDYDAGYWTLYTGPVGGRIKFSKIAGYGTVLYAISNNNNTVWSLDTAAASPSWSQWDSNWFTEIDAENGRLYLLGIPTSGGQYTAWSRYMSGGNWTEWGGIYASKIAGDANGLAWVATNAQSNPIYQWQNGKWTFGPPSGPVYEMAIQSYVKIYVVSDPAVGGGHTLWDHSLYGGGWTQYPDPT